ncbi:hypothetical protein N9X64_00520 [bacterium]|nr:hypothetical protein [bacterium]
MSNQFLQPGECFVDLPDSDCGAFNGRVLHEPPDYVCADCAYILGTETDIEAGDDSDYQPGDSDGTDGEGEDDEQNDSSPVNPLDNDDTPEEAMERDTQIQFRQIIGELEESELETDFYTSFFANNFEDIIHFYMLFTKYGPYTIIDRPDKKKEVIVETSCAFMLMEKRMTRFEILAKAMGYSETSLIQKALFFVETYKGDEFEKGAYLIPTYAMALGLTSNFNEPMKKVWLEINHPRGQLRDLVVSYIVAYARKSSVKITQNQAHEATLVSRGTLSPKIKQYEEILEIHLNL